MKDGKFHKLRHMLLEYLFKYPVSDFTFKMGLLGIEFARLRETGKMDQRILDQVAK